MFIGYGTVVENTAWFPWLALECAEETPHTREQAKSNDARPAGVGLRVVALPADHSGRP
jgi:hypothetical protein